MKTRVPEISESAPQAPMPSNALAVTDGPVTVSATLRGSTRPMVQLFVDGVVVQVDAFDLAAAKAREKFAACVPESLRASVNAALIQLAERATQSAVAGKAGPSASVIVPPIEVWPDPIEPAHVLSMVKDRLERHVHLPPHTAPVVVGWLLLTYLLDVLPHAPLLWVYSPTKGCGKSVLLDLVTLLAARPLKSANATLAVLFRIAESDRPTIVLDEIDQWLQGDRQGEVAGFLNASFTRGETFLRTVGDAHEPKAFNVFGCRAVGGIGSGLHPTTRSRAYRVPMERAPAGALPFPLQPMFAKSWAQPLCQQLARCAVQLQERMRARFEDPDATPFPPFLDGRARDLWLPLLALGEEVGEPWNTYIREACAVLARAAADDIADSGEQLLADVRRFFDGRRDQYATPSDLLSWLVEQDGSPWPEYAHGRPLTARGLATLLQPFKIKSAPARIGGAKTRAYYAADFNEAWKRYNTPSGSALHSGNISSASEPSHAFPVVGERGTHGTLGTDGTSPKRFGLFTDGALGDETTDPPRSTTGHGGPGLENVPFARAG